jgi:hypothetical protein
LNLLDGREVTAWCTAGSDPLNEQLGFGFKGTARIDEIRIYTGNGFDDSTFTSFSRAKKFSIKGPAGARTFTVADQRGLQAIAFDPPLVGAHFTMEVLDLFPAEDPESPVCVTDVIFLSGGKPLNGSWLTTKLKYDKQQAPYLGTWFAGYEGAPDKFLSFFFDGTYRFVFDPYDKTQNKERSFEGDYQASGSRITLEVPSKGKVTVKVVRDKADPKNPKAPQTLKFEGDLPEDLKHVFRDHL